MGEAEVLCGAEELFILWIGSWPSSLDNIYPKFIQLLSYSQLVMEGESNPPSLGAVPKCCIKGFNVID